MRRGTENIENPGLCNRSQIPLRSMLLDAERLAALAAMTFSRQNPGLILPAIADIPSSYTHVRGGDTTVALARSLVQLGLGSPELWKRHNANPSLFIRGAINEWLESLGANTLDQEVHIDLAITEELDDFRPEEGKFIILIETSDGCGFLAVGRAIGLLENEEAGLGRAFYIVLMRAMNLWMEIYDLPRTECFLDQWKESIEMDIEADASEEAFQQYCNEHGFTFPDLKGATPPCVRDISFHKERWRVGHSLGLLRKHRNGKYAEWIEPVLRLASFRKTERGMDYQDIDGIWDDTPLPNWVVAFEPHDPITQAFDEEREHMYESSHAPTWIDSFNPSDENDVKRVLNHVRSVVLVNRQLVNLSLAIDRSTDSGSTDQSQFDNQLRVA